MGLKSLKKGIITMRKFISAVTSLCVAATMVTAIAPATVSAAQDSSKALSLLTWDAAYGSKEASIKVDSATDVTIPVGMYLTEGTNDVNAMAAQATIAIAGKKPSEYTDAEKAALAGFKTHAYSKSDTYFADAHTYTGTRFGDVSSKLALYFHSSQNSRTKDVQNAGSYQVAAAESQSAALTDYAYYGMSWTESADPVTEYTGTNSDDFPVSVFDITIPAGTPDGEYEFRFLNYDTDPSADKLVPSTLVQTAGEIKRYQTDAVTDDGMEIADWTNNLELNSLKITVGDGATQQVTTTTAVTPATTTTVAPTTTTPVAGDVDVVVGLDMDDKTLDVSSADASTWMTYNIINSNGNPIVAYDSNFRIEKKNEDGTWTAVTDGSIAATDAADGKALPSGGFTYDLKYFSANSPTITSTGAGSIATDGLDIFAFEITAKTTAAAGTYRIVPNTKLQIVKATQPTQIDWTTNYDLDPASVVVEFEVVSGATPATTTTTTAPATTTTTTSAPPATTTTTAPVTQPGDPLYGDTNCDGHVNISDVVLLNKYLNNNADYAITDKGKLNADCYNPQGGADLTTADSNAIINFIVGNVTLPVNK